MNQSELDLKDKNNTDEIAEPKKYKKIKRVQNSTFLIISLITLTLLIVAVTVTWFVLHYQVKVNGLSLKTSQWDFIVSRTSQGEPINDSDVIDFNIDSFANVSERVIAPGSYGNIKLYARSNSDADISCVVKLNKDNLTLKVDDTHDYSDILQKHFIFYKDAAMTQELTPDDPISIKFSKGEEKEIIIYWEWPYDGTKTIPPSLTGEEREEFLNNYDSEDNIIGNNRDYIGGNITLDISAVNEQQNN